MTRPAREDCQAFESPTDDAIVMLKSLFEQTPQEVISDWGPCDINPTDEFSFDVGRAQGLYAAILYLEKNRGCMPYSTSQLARGPIRGAKKFVFS